MSEPVRFVLLGLAIVVVCLLVLWLTRTLVDDACDWLDRRSCERARYIECELVKTKEVLALVSQAQATMLDACAHEAAVALIMESYRASVETGDDAP